MSQEVFLRKYGEATTIPFGLLEVDGVDFRVDAVYAAGDVKISKDEGAETNITSGFVDEGTGYSQAVSATELEAARIVLYLVDQTATKVWLDRQIVIETYGHASAMHAFDLDAATVDLNADQSGATIGTVNNVSGLVAGTGGISVAAESFTLTVGGAPTNDYTDTRAHDGTYHIVPPSGADTDGFYQFDIGNAGVPQTVSWIGYAQSNGDSYAVYAYNYALTTYEQIGTITASNGTSEMIGTFDLLTDHVGEGATAGKVRFRFLSADGTNIATDRVFCTFTQATTGIANGSTITLTADALNQNFVGNTWNMDLNGQTISGSYFSTAVSFLGTGVIANGNPAVIQGSKIDTCTLSAYFIMGRCVLSDTLTIVSTSGGSDDTVDLFNCASGKKGVAAPTIDASGVTKTTGIQNRLYGGGVTYSINSFCTLSHEVLVGGAVTLTNAAGVAKLRGLAEAVVVTSSGAATTDIIVTSGAPITVNGTGGTVNVYGTHGGITDTSGASVTINDLGMGITLTDGAAALAAFFTSSDQLVKDFWNKVLSKANFNIGQSGAKMLRELGVIIAAEGAVSGTPTTTTFTTNITGYDNNFFVDQVVAAYNGAAMAGQGRVVSAYNGTTGEFIVDEAFTTALSPGDDVVILTPHVHAVSQIATEVRTEMDSNSTQLAAIKATTDNLPSAVKKNTALANFEFFMRDTADHATGKTGLTVTAERSIDGAAFGACVNSVSEVSAGVYKISLAAGDLNGDTVTLKFTSAGADATIITILTKP